MKKIMLNTKEVSLKTVDIRTPIFAKRNGKFVGMIANERKQPISDPNPDRWILRLGGTKGCSGWYQTRQECIKDAKKYGFEFYVEVDN